MKLLESEVFVLQKRILFIMFVIFCFGGEINII